MKQRINSGNNNINFFPQDDNFIINHQPENFFEDEDPIANIQNLGLNQNINLNTSIDLPNNNNNKPHDSSIKTNATFGEISQKEKDNFSFFSFNNQNQAINIFEKKKELTKESIDILNNFINKENLIISNVNNIYGGKNNIINNVYVKDNKNFLFNLENKLSIYFKTPYMRKNIKTKKSIIKNKYKYKYDDDDQDEDEKINIDEKNSKMEDIKDDDSKTNNDSFEEINTAYDKKYVNK